LGCGELLLRSWPRQAFEHSGHVELRRAELVGQAKRELSEEQRAQIQAELPIARAKLDRLLENRARQIAEETGDGEA
jgi:hypothetical protein